MQIYIFFDYSPKNKNCHASLNQKKMGPFSMRKICLKIGITLIKHNIGKDKFVEEKWTRVYGVLKAA